MSKYTKELAAVTDRVNSAIKNNGYEIKIGHRNGYTAIDLHNDKGGCLDYITAGITDREAIDYLHAMLKGIGLVSNTNTKN